MVVEGRSRFADRIGERITLENFSLYDDGQLPEALNTATVDAEGVPRQKTTLIEKGVLKSFLFDTYYARIFGEAESTANASRGGQGFNSTPQIGVSTLVVSKGPVSINTAISELSEGIYMQDYIMGLEHSDPISGDFSAVAPQSLYIKDGEVEGALEPVTIAGNYYKGLNDIRHLCSDEILTPFNIMLPSIVIDGFTVSG